MSILIKGMEMPKNCMSCPFPSVGVDWYYCYCPGVDGKAYDFEQSNTVPDDCPLVALPDHHGDLIDRDEFKETLDYYIREAGWSDEHNEALTWVKDDFIDAEMIIVEAEDET